MSRRNLLPVRELVTCDIIDPDALRAIHTSLLERKKMSSGAIGQSVVFDSRGCVRNEDGNPDTESFRPIGLAVVEFQEKHHVGVAGVHLSALLFSYGPLPCIPWHVDAENDLFAVSDKASTVGLKGMVSAIRGQRAYETVLDVAKDDPYFEQLPNLALTQAPEGTLLKITPYAPHRSPVVPEEVEEGRLLVSATAIKNLNDH